MAKWRASLLEKGLKGNAGKYKVMVGRNGRKIIVNSGKFRELWPFLTSRAPPLEMKGRVYVSCVRSSMIYGSETRALLVDVGLQFERAEMQMIRWMCGISMKDRRTNEELGRMVGVEPITTVMRTG